MPKRLSEQYAIGDAVEILFEQMGWSDWMSGVVVGMQAPGLWVRLANGGMWFVTNTQRIRALPPSKRDEV
jgi:hypothetical protein